MYPFRHFGFVSFRFRFVLVSSSCNGNGVLTFFWPLLYVYGYIVYVVLTSVRCVWAGGTGGRDPFTGDTRALRCVMRKYQRPSALIK